VIDMRTLIAVWLAKWQAGFVIRLLGWVDRLTRPAAVAGRPMPRGAMVNRRGHHHSIEEHAVPGLWLMSPRLKVGLWLAGAVVALAHDLHLIGGPGPDVEIHQLGRIGRH
jgi:hypothetical protein